MKSSEALKELDKIETEVKRAKKLTKEQRFALNERINDLREKVEAMQ